MPVPILSVKGYEVVVVLNWHGCEKKPIIPGLVSEERHGDGEDLVSPVRDRILTKVSQAQKSDQIQTNFRDEI